jgi:hypothetical protein
MKLKPFVFGVTLGLVSFLAFAGLARAAQTVAPVAEWNILFYLNGKNDLQSEMQDFILKNLYAMSDVNARMKGGGRNIPLDLPPNVNVLVEYGTLRKICDPKSVIDRNLDLCRLGVKRFRMIQGANQVRDPRSAFQDLGRVDMGDEETLVDFAYWSRQFPAKKTVLYVFNHGAQFESTSEGLFSFDDESKNSMNAREIADGFRKISRILGRPIDLFVTDMCLAGSVEALGQMEGSLRYYVASRENVSGYSINVIEILRMLEKYPGLSAKRWAYQLVQMANRAQARTDFSAFDLGGIPAFEASLADMISALRSQPLAARREFQKHFLEKCRLPSIDAENSYEFRDILSCFYTMPGMREWPEYRRLTHDYYKVLFTNSNSINKSGMSIWGGSYRQGMASPSALADYRLLKFDARARWSDFIEMLGEGRNQGR